MLQVMCMQQHIMLQHWRRNNSGALALHWWQLSGRSPKLFNALAFESKFSFRHV